MGKFIRRTVELVDKRRDELATNDEFTKNFTLNISKTAKSILLNLAQFNNNVSSQILHNFSFLCATEKKIMGGGIMKISCHFSQK
jgi:hypothetical protein